MMHNEVCIVFSAIVCNGAKAVFSIEFVQLIIIIGLLTGLLSTYSSVSVAYPRGERGPCPPPIYF